MPDNNETTKDRRRPIRNVEDVVSAATTDAAARSSTLDAQLTPPQPRASLQRVRFSTETDRPVLGVDTEATNLSADTLTPQSDVIPIQTHPRNGPSASTRRRNRGYSLRRQLFFRNAENQLQDAPMLEQIGSKISVAHTTSSDSAPDMSKLDRSTSPDLKNPDAPMLPISHPKRGISPGTPSLWAQKHYHPHRDKIFAFCVNLKKTILRQHELPPTKEGRKIPLDLTRTEHLIDERTGRHYVNNIIRSSRYTVLNFLPKQLFAQFSKLANFYFLCVSILQMIPTLSTTGTYTTIVPLIFFISLSMFKEGYDDYRRYKLDRIENNRDAQVLQSDPNSEKLPDWHTIKWKDIQVGDIVRLERDDWVPADLLILHSEGENGIAYIETMALDGETNLKSKQALPVIAEHCDTIEKLVELRAEVIVEDPNPDLYNFEGKVNIGKETKPLTNHQVIYRGSVLRNTPSMCGMVIFSGEESKIRMNANKNPRTKAPTLQALVNKIVIMIVFFVIFLAVFCSVAYQFFWRKNVEQKSWFLSDSAVAFFPIFASYVIMFNTLIPLSLYVSLEIIKVAQMLLLNDIDMYHEETDTPFEARTSTINEDCGQISYIFSDKTGTLTDNSMLFRKLSVGGQAWLHDLDIRHAASEEAAKLKHNKKRKGRGKGKSRTGKKTPAAHSGYGNSSGAPTRKSMGDVASSRPPVPPHRRSLEQTLAKKDSLGSLRWKSSADPSRPQPQMSTSDLLEYLRTHPHTFFARKARFFLLSIALCHTCLPEEAEDGSIDYQAASPDELALVRAAQELGYIAIERQFDSITIKTYPNGLNSEPLTEVYQILEVIEFSSKRKRMSILIRMPNGRICIFSKGADTTMIELLKLRDLAKSKARMIERKESVRRSIEAQEMIRRNSMHRTSIGGRTSIGDRTSIGGPSRPSFTRGRLRPIHDQLDYYLRNKERDYLEEDSDSDDDDDGDSAQYASRHSIALGDRSTAPLDPGRDEHIVDEELVLDDSKVFERCFQHVNHFATEGLRTLLYAHRFIEEQEYITWRSIYSEATTSLVDRTARIEAAAEIIEKDFELTGATAIEDKLQKGVPEAIDKLRSAGIKLWMLTGDKRETAINIGYSCRLIKDYSTVTILSHDDPVIASTMRAAIADISQGKVAHSVVVVDGGTLAIIEADEGLGLLFFELAVSTDSVICCRASPSQKAGLVKKIRTKVTKSVTLAIGDGANDIAMIQEAHVGVGITGKEGLQAARVSDYSMAQFRFLLKFLLVHGRWNYVRTTKYTVATFWKEMLFYLTQALFQRYCGYTGSSLYEPWSLSMFNTLFTSLPVLCLGIFTQDLRASTLLAIPELYSYGRHNQGFNLPLYLQWMLLAILQSLLSFFLPYLLFSNRLMSDQSIYALGTLSYTVCVILISIKMQGIEMHNKNLMAALSFLLSVGGWALWNVILSLTYANNVIHNVRKSLLEQFGRDGNWWLTMTLTVMACVLLDLLGKVVWNWLKPTQTEIWQELEKREEVRRRCEVLAMRELEMGWGGDREREVERILREREKGVEEAV